MQEFPAAQLIKHQCEDNRCREGNNQVLDTQRQGVPQQAPEIITGKEFLEIPESDPCAAEKALREFEVFESHHNTEHRQIAEDNVPDDHRQQQQVNHPVLPHIPSEPLSERLFPGGYFHRHSPRSLKKSSPGLWKNRGCGVPTAAPEKHAAKIISRCNDPQQPV